LRGETSDRSEREEAKIVARRGGWGKEKRLIKGLRPASKLAYHAYERNHGSLKGANVFSISNRSENPKWTKHVVLG